MASKKNSSGPHSGPPRGSFTSLRIIGEKAQKLLAKAREMQQKSPNGKESQREEQADELPEVLVHLSIASVVRSAFAILAIFVGVVLVWFLLDKIVLLLLSIFVAMIIDPGVQFLPGSAFPAGSAF